MARIVFPHVNILINGLEFGNKRNKPMLVI